MKNLYTKNEFLNLKQEDQILNEGFLGKMFKSLWNSAVKLANKIKGSKEINVIYDKYKKLIDETFIKMQNVEGVKTATEKPKPAATPVEEEPTKTTTKPKAGAPEGQQPSAQGQKPAGTVVQDNQSVSFLNEADVAQPEVAQAQPDQNTKDVSNLSNLKPDQIKNLSAQTTKRIAQLQTQFDTDVNNTVARLTKNPNYSSDKLKQFGVVMKNQLNSYVYDQWYSFYTKIGDQTKILEVTKIKKENDLKFKQSIQELNTKLGEKEQTTQVKTGKEYKYYSETNKAEINIKVIGKELGQDEKGATDTEHANMWKVTNPDTNKSFWVSPNSIKGAKDFNLEIGKTYSYTNKKGETNEVTIVKADGDGVLIQYPDVALGQGKTKKGPQYKLSPELLPKLKKK